MRPKTQELPTFKSMQYVFDIIHDHSLEKMVTGPTRQGNALDLILTNIPQLVPRMEITPGLSDHDTVYAEFSIPTHQQSAQS